MGTARGVLEFRVWYPQRSRLRFTTRRIRCNVRAGDSAGVCRGPGRPIGERMRSTCRVCIWIMLCLIGAFAGSVLAQPVNTTSTTSATEIIPGSPVYLFNSITTYIGPQTIRIGNQTGCIATAPFPPPACTLTFGTGTLRDPFVYVGCKPALTGCAGGSVVSIVPGGQEAGDAQCRRRDYECGGGQRA